MVRREVYRRRPYDERRVAAYLADVSPIVQRVVTKAVALFGESDPVVAQLVIEARIPHGNYVGMHFLAEELQRLREALLLR
jgi:hypothetical protein